MREASPFSHRLFGGVKKGLRSDGAKQLRGRGAGGGSREGRAREGLARPRRGPAGSEDERTEAPPRRLPSAARRV